MYTTFVIDEVGNRKIIMDWRGNPPFQWNEVKVEDFLVSHPNSCSGLEFAHYYTGDDYGEQEDKIVTPEFCLLPDFKTPDLPCPRKPLLRTGLYTRPPADADSEADESDCFFSCGYCDWRGRFSEITKRSMSKYFIDWTCPNCGEEQASGGLSEPQPPVRIKASNDDPGARPRLRCGLCAWSEGLPEPFGLQMPALISLNEARRTGVTPGYPNWANVDTRDNGIWFVHSHCGRTTHDLAEVTKEPELLSLDWEGHALSVVREHWRLGNQRWASCGLLREDAGGVVQESLSSAIALLLQLEEAHDLHWETTPRFLFGRTAR